MQQHNIIAENLYLPIPNHLCAWAESTWTAIGVVDRRGQQKRTICSACEPCYVIRSELMQVFLPFLTDWLYLQLAQMPRSQNQTIFVQMTDDRQTMTTNKTDHFTPSACTWGNNSNRNIHRALTCSTLQAPVSRNCESNCMCRVNYYGSSVAVHQIKRKCRLLNNNNNTIGKPYLKQFDHKPLEIS